jgi:acyl carrier protein
VEILSTIHDYLITEFAADRESFAPGENLLAQGIIDSMGILKLVEFLEQTFGIQTEDEEMVPENFESLDALCAFVQRKRSA